MQVGGWPLERRRDGVVVPGGVGEPAMPSGRHGALARGCPTPRQARLRLVVRRPARGPAAAWSFFSRHRRQGEAAGGGTWSCVGGPYAAQPAQTARPRRPLQANVITTTPDTPLQQARAACKQHGIGGMPVVDRGGKVCGAGPPAAGLCYPAACLPSSCHAPAPAPCLAAHAPPRGGLPPQPTPSPSLSPCPHLTLLSSLCPLPFQTPPAASGHHLEERLPPGRRRRAGRHDRRRGGGAPQGRHPRRSGADAAGGSRAGGVSGCVCVCVCVLGLGPQPCMPPAAPRPPCRRRPEARARLTAAPRLPCPPCPAE